MMTSSGPGMPNGHLEGADVSAHDSGATFLGYKLKNQGDNDDCSYVPRRRPKRYCGSEDSDTRLIGDTPRSSGVTRHNIRVVLKLLHPKTLLTQLNPILLATDLDNYASSGLLRLRNNYRRNLLPLDARYLNQQRPS